jgi:hypothetical protein
MNNTKILPEAIVPPGEYYVGDPCYAVPNDKWMEWLEDAEYMIQDQRHVLYAEVYGYPAVGVSTMYGDGQYRGSDGNTYPVDAGLLGLVDRRMVSEPCDSPLITITKPAKCWFDADTGEVHLGDLVIMTGDEDEEDEDEEDEDY